MEKLKHTLTVQYIQGTNDKDYVNEASAATKAFTYGRTLTERTPWWKSTCSPHTDLRRTDRLPGPRLDQQQLLQECGQYLLEWC